MKRFIIFIVTIAILTVNIHAVDYPKKAELIPVDDTCVNFFNISDDVLTADYSLNPNDFINYTGNLISSHSGSSGKFDDVNSFMTYHSAKYQPNSPSRFIDIGIHNITAYHSENGFLQFRILIYSNYGITGFSNYSKIRFRNYYYDLSVNYYHTTSISFDDEGLDVSTIDFSIPSNLTGGYFPTHIYLDPCFNNHNNDLLVSEVVLYSMYNVENPLVFNGDYNFNNNIKNLQDDMKENASDYNESISVFDSILTGATSTFSSLSTIYNVLMNWSVDLQSFNIIFYPFKTILILVVSIISLNILVFKVLLRGR